MFRREHHNRVLQLLQSFDGQALADAHCYFGGGTAIVLKLDEYRESVDLDFLCSDVEGYRRLRSAVDLPLSLGALMRAPVEYARDVRAERDKILTRVRIDGISMKVEFVLEGRISVRGWLDAELGVPVLARTDMYAEKLLANADRCLDRAVLSRDAIDLAMMISRWGPIPDSAWEKATAAYGGEILKYLGRAVDMLDEDAYLHHCLDAMSMRKDLAEQITSSLRAELARRFRQA